MRRFIILHPGWALSVFAVFVVVAVLVGLGFSFWVGQLESRLERNTAQLESYEKSLERIESASQATSERAAWLEGYLACEEGLPSESN